MNRIAIALLMLSIIDTGHAVEKPAPATIDELNKSSKVVVFAKVEGESYVLKWDGFNPVVELKVIESIGEKPIGEKIVCYWGKDPSGFVLYAPVTPPSPGSTWILYYTAASDVGRFTARYGQGIHAASPQIWEWVKAVGLEAGMKTPKGDVRLPPSPQPPPPSK